MTLATAPQGVSRPPRWRARPVFGVLACVALLLVPVATPAAAADVSPAVVACVKKALGPAASSVLSGSDAAMGRLSVQQRGLVEGCLLTEGRPGGPASAKPPRLTVSPIDPARVTSMSRFRSCAGHDYSGRNVQGQAESERSMKNYLYVDVPWTSTGSVTVRAPFSGTAIATVESDYPLGSWVRVLHRDGWVFTAFHVDPQVRTGQRVKAGSPIATFPPANAPSFMPERMSEPEANLDFSLQSTDGRLAPFVDSLTPVVRRPWEALGFTPTALTISRADRDAAPCARDFPDGPGSSGFVSRTTSP